METIKSAEKRRARAIADDYRKRGYEVLEEPTQEQLPGFLSGCSLDVLAHKMGESAESLGESIAVVVKARKGSSKSNAIRELSASLQGKPGWKFQLASVDIEWQLELPETAAAFVRKEVWDCCAEAQRLLEAGFEEAALMRAWAAATASVRLLLDEDRALDEEERMRDYDDGPAADGHGLSADRFKSRYMFPYAVYRGIISNEQNEFLLEVKRWRDAYANGYKLPGFNAAETVGEIITTVRRIWGLPASPDPY